MSVHVSVREGMLGPQGRNQESWDWIRVTHDLLVCSLRP